MSDRKIVTCSNGHRCTVPSDSFSDGYAATHACPICGRGVPKERSSKTSEHGGLRTEVNDQEDCAACGLHWLQIRALRMNGNRCDNDGCPMFTAKQISTKGNQAMTAQPQELDIVERLLNYGRSHIKGMPDVIREAADEITRLRAQPSQREVTLEKALRGLMDVQVFATGWDNGVTDSTGTINEGAYWHSRAMDDAQAALSQASDGRHARKEDGHEPE